MSGKNNEITVGIAVLAALSVIVVLVFLFGKSSFPSMGEEYEILVKFDKAPGITKDSPVLQSGIKVGRVKSVELRNEPDRRYAEVVLLVKKDIPIYSNDECRIILSSLLSGDSNLEILKSRESREEKDSRPPVVVPPGSEIRGVNPLDMMQSLVSLEGDVTGAVKNISTAAEKMSGFIDAINVALGSEEEMQARKIRFQSLLNQSEQTMEVVQALAGHVDELMNDPDLNQGLRRIATELPDTMEKARHSLENIDGFTSEARTTMNRITGTFDKVQLNLDHLGDFTETLGKDGPEIVQSLSVASKRLGGVFSDISNLMENVKNADGTLARLMRDPELYREIRSTMENVEEITRTLQPIVRDFRIFSDKIARDPGVLGVRGAIMPNTPLKGGSAGFPEARPLPRRSLSDDTSVSGVASAGFYGGLRSGTLSQPMYFPHSPRFSYSLRPLEIHDEMFDEDDGQEVRSGASHWWNRPFFRDRTPLPEMLPRQTVVRRALQSASHRHTQDANFDHAVMETECDETGCAGSGTSPGDCSCERQLLGTTHPEPPSHAAAPDFQDAHPPYAGSTDSYDESYYSGSYTDPRGDSLSDHPSVTPVPVLGRQVSSEFQTLPATILEFEPLDGAAGREGTETENERGTATETEIRAHIPLPPGEAAHVYPSNRRGYVIELESRVQPPARVVSARQTDGPAAEVSNANPAANLSFELPRKTEEEIRNAAALPEPRFSNRPLRSFSVEKSSESPLRKVTMPTGESGPQYGSYRRFR